MADFRIGDYDYTIIDSENRYVEARVWDKTKVIYGALSSTIEYDGVIYTLTSMRQCFKRCTSFNQFIEIPNSVTNLYDCFRECRSFNRPIKIPNSVTDMELCFAFCSSFNQRIFCFNKPISYDRIFEGNAKDITIIAIGEDNYSTWKTIADSYPKVSIPNSFAFEYGDYEYTGTTDGIGVKVIDKTKVEYEEILKTYINNRKVTSMERCFYNCTSFNQPIEIPDSVTNMRYCFGSCTSFNKSIKIPNSVTNMTACFIICTSFNKPIEIPDSVTNMHFCFAGCFSLNRSILCFNKPTSYNGIFDSTEKDITIIAIGEDNYSTWVTIVNSQPDDVSVSIPNSFEFDYGDYRYIGTTDGVRVKVIDKTKVEYGEILKTYINNRKVTNINACFMNCTSFNQPIEIPDSVTYMNDCFRGCTSFNQPIEIPDSVINMDGCFFGCTSFNQLITFKDNSSVTSMYSCFSNCVSFNRSIDIPGSVADMGWCFGGCTSFNRSIKIPKSVRNMVSCFRYCTSFNQSIEIPSSIMYMPYCFANCTSLETNIKIKSPIGNLPGAKLYNIFSNTEKDIYIINDADPSLKESAAEVWRKVANEHPNVHYELDDHPSPLLELEVRRVDERSKPSTSGTYALVNLKYTISNSFVPYDYPAPSLESESLVLDNIRTIPLTEKRDYLIKDIDDNQHVFVYTVSDGYRTSTITRILSRVLALLDFQGDSGKDYVDKPGMGMAIGTIATRNGLAIQFPVAIGDELLPATKEVYVLTTDTEFNPEKEYYEKDGDNYVLTEDTEFIDGKKYYEYREAVDLDNYQLIIGQYNKEDKTKAFIIGNGEVNEGVVRRSNVFTIDWNGNTIAKSLKLISDAGKEAGLRLTDDGKTNAKFGWDTDNNEGAGFSLRNADYPVEGEKGSFIIWATNGDKRFNLTGKPDGQLMWKGRLIPYGKGTKITPTFRGCTNGAYTTCRKIGNLVILSFNINVTTATEANYDYLTGLPNAVEGFAGSSAIGTSAGRWWVTTTGTLRFDGTPTVGWHNGNITYICQ